MSRKIILIAASIVLVVSAAAILVAYFTGAIDRTMTRDMAAVGDKFLRAVRNDDYGVIVDIVTPALLEEIGPTGQNMQDHFNETDLKPSTWEFTNREYIGTQGQMSGPVVFTRGRQGRVELSLFKLGREWKIAGFLFEEK
jgi:hypothetical protein